VNKGLYGTNPTTVDLLNSLQESNTFLAGPSSGYPDVPEGRPLVLADEQSPALRYFGDGAEGDFSISTSTFTGGPFTSGALARSAFINNLTLLAGGRITLGGFFCLIRGIFDIRTVTTGSGIRMNGNNGITSTSATGAASSSASAGNFYGGSVGSAAGGNGTTTTGATAAAISTPRCICPRTPGAGGKGGDGSPGVGGSGSTTVNQNLSIAGSGPNFRFPCLYPLSLNGTTSAAISGVFGGTPGGSGGGGGGDSTNSGRGGGSGAEGGRTVWLFARTIARSAATAVGVISSIGGNGGSGSAPTAGNAGGGGAGGGGAGGLVYIGYENLIGTPCIGCIDVSGGNGGTGGNGRGTGLGGQGGQGGQAGVVYLANLKTGVVSYIPATGGAIATASVPGTITGSAGTAGETFRVDL